MEFLDDILNQDAEGEPEDEEASQEAEAPEGDAWEALLAGVSYDEPVEASEAPSRKRSSGDGLTGMQKIILGVLGLLVVGVWVVIVFLMSRSLPASDGPAAASGEDAEVTVVSYAEMTPGAASTATAQATSSLSAAEDEEPTPGPTNTPEPDATPTPAPVFTSYDRQIQQDPMNPTLYVERAQEYIERHAYRAAIGDLQQAKELDDEIPALYVELGWAHYYLGEWMAAESAFGTAIAFDQDQPRAHFGLGKVYYYEGRYEEAAEEFDWAAEINPQDAEAEAWLAIASARMDDLTEAEGAVTRAISQSETLPIVYIARSWARRIQEPPDIDGAQGDLLYARELEPNDFLTLNALAGFYLVHRPERLSEAEQLGVYARNWAENEVERAVALHTLGRIYLEQSRKSEAREVLSQAADLISADGEILLAGLIEDLERARD